MASPFAPDDDEDQSSGGSDYYGPAAQLLPQQVTQAQPQQVPQYVAAAPGNALAPMLPQQGTPQQAPAIPTAPPSQQQPKIMLPTAPDLPKDDIPAYQALADKKAADSARPNVAPKWWERLAGAAVGFGTGYKEGPTAGIRAGSAVTTRGEDEALKDQQGKLAQDDAALQGWQRSHDLANEGYERQAQQFGQNMSIAGAERAQSNEDRNFGRETANDTRNQSNADRTFDYEKLVHGDEQGNKNRDFDLDTKRFGETVRHNKADEANSASSVDRRSGSGSGNKTTVTPAQFQTILTQRDREYQTEQKGYEAKKATAFDAADKADIETAHQKALDDLQDRWNNRLATADPEGKYAPKPGGQAPPAAAPKAAPAATPAPPKGNGKKLTDATIAQRYLALAGGDKAKARQLAAKDNWKF